MQTPPRRPSHLHAVGNDERKPNPMGQYKDMFIGAMVVTIATVTTTLGIHWVANRASRKKEREETNPQAQLAAGLAQVPPGYHPGMQHPFAPSPFQMPPALPPGGMWIYAPQGASPFGPPAPVAAAPTYPAALQSHGNPVGRPSKAANQSAPPPWFSSWANDFTRAQDQRFTTLEEQIGSVAAAAEEYEEDDVG